MCHGKHGEGRAHGGGVYPRLAGQPAGYLYKQLRRFQSGRRSGIPPVAAMDRLLDRLPDAYLRLIAEHYRRASPPFPPASKRSPARWREGQKLAHHGLPAKHVAACGGCHGTDFAGKPPDVPALAGQYARYLVVQFEHWAQGARPGKVHKHIADVFTDKQILAVAHYLASLRPNGGTSGKNGAGESRRGAGR
jgi:cytochrome c553